METKEELVTNIKEWIKMDTEINKLQQEIKDRKNKAEDLNRRIADSMNCKKTR
jgi:hypothetical protein